MLNIGYGCPACGAYLRDSNEEGAHTCLRDGAKRYSVLFCEAPLGEELRTVLVAGLPAAVLTHLCSVVDPENYEVTEWIGRAGLGTAYEGERTWGDLWLEENA